MTSTLDFVSPIQNFQYPAKGFVAPLPLSLFGELDEEELVVSDFHERASPSAASIPVEAVPSSFSAAPTSLPSFSHENDAKFEDFDDEFGDFEFVPADWSVIPDKAGNFSQDLLVLGREGSSAVTRAFLADFESLSLSSAPAPLLSSELRGDGNFVEDIDADIVQPRSEANVVSLPVFDLFGDSDSTFAPQSVSVVTKDSNGNVDDFFFDFSVHPVVRAREKVENGEIEGWVGNAEESFDPGISVTAEVESLKSGNDCFDSFGNLDSGILSQGFLKGEDFHAGRGEHYETDDYSIWDFQVDNRGTVPQTDSGNNPEARSDPPGSDLLSRKSEGLNDSILDADFFSQESQTVSRENGGASDDDWGDFVALPPPVQLKDNVAGTQSLGNLLDSAFGGFSDTTDTHGNIMGSSSQGEQTGLMDFWVGPIDPQKADGSHTGNTLVELDSPAHSTPAKVDVLSFYEAQVDQFFPLSSPSKLSKDKKAAVTVDLDVLYAQPNVAPKFSTAVKSALEHSTQPLSLSLFGEEDVPSDATDLSSASSLNQYVRKKQSDHAANGDQKFASASSEHILENEPGVDADELYLAKAEELNQLTLCLLEEGRVEEALACTRHTAALLEYQEVQEDYSRALESGDEENLLYYTANIEVAHAKLAKPKEWYSWQTRQSPEVAFRNNGAPPKLSYENMIDLLGGMRDPRGSYFRAAFYADDADTLANKDSRAAAKHFKNAVEVFHLLIIATVQEQLLYVKAWSALASSCASELELGRIFWQRAVQIKSEAHLLTHRKGRNYFAALGQVYAVFLMLEATVRLYAPWLTVAGEKGQAVYRLLEECRGCWRSTGLKDAVFGR